MSLILDALNKADRERQNTDVPPGIHTIHEDQHHTLPRSNWLYIGLGTIALVIMVLAALAWFFLSGNKNQASEPANTTNQTLPLATSSQAEEKPSAAIPGLPKPSLDAKKSPRPQAKPNSPALPKESVNALYQKKQKEKLRSNKPLAEPRIAGNVMPKPKPKPKQIVPKPSEPAAVQAGAKPKPEIRSQVAIAPVNQNLADKTQTDTTTNNKKPTNKSTSPATKPPDSSKRLSAFPNAVAITDLPWTVLQGIPTLNYTAHSYSENGRSQITINDRSLRKGDKISQEIKIEEILEDGIILRLKEHQFKLQAFGSWVNL